MNPEFFSHTTAGGVDLHIYATPRFKTTTIAIMVQQALRPETVTKTAMLSEVLKRGCESFPTTLQLREHLDNLYGATFGMDISKKGEKHILLFYLDIPHEEYLRQEKRSLVNEALAFLSEVALHPLLTDGAFQEKFFIAAKESILRVIKSLIDDKMAYAAERCIAEMCKEEPYGLFTYGRLDDLPHLKADDLYQYYQGMLTHCPIDLFVVGDVEEEAVRRQVENLFSFSRELQPLPQTVVKSDVQEVKTVVERMKVIQGKLNLGLRTGIVYEDELYPALLVYNGILGGFAHSKLFRNVREAASLAYYAASRIDAYKGIMTIHSGIQIENYNAALEIIEQQLNLMRQGQITKTEMDQTGAVLTNQLLQSQDRAMALIDTAYHGVISGRDRQVEALIEQIQEVSIEQVQEVASRVKLDTVYFLRDENGQVEKDREEKGVE